MVEPRTGPDSVARGISERPAGRRERPYPVQAGILPDLRDQADAIDGRLKSKPIPPADGTAGAPTAVVGLVRALIAYSSLINSHFGG
jgi:hypothetical protein